MSEIKADPPKVVVLLSGGLDSTVLLYMMEAMGYDVHALSVHYGQKHSTELKYAQATCFLTGSFHHIVDLSDVKKLLGGSSLTDGGMSVPEGHYAAENMAQTVVPNRNAFLLALAYGLATSIKAKKVCTAVHAGDHAIYPDCRPEFINAFEEMEKLSITREIYGISAPLLFAPFLKLSKAQIVGVGRDNGVPFQSTWSCYNGAIIHCGRCGTCVERIGAFNVAGVYDPTLYEDKEFAERVLREKGEWKERPTHSVR